MNFTSPVIGPKVYISRGPSGHPETFSRQSADEQLIAFFGDMPLKVPLEGFLRHMTLQQRPETWTDVLDFIGKLTETEADDVPLVVAIAFWAQVKLTRDEIAAARKKAAAEKGERPATRR